MCRHSRLAQCAKIVAKTTDGRTITHSRKYRTCSKRRPGKKHPL